MKHLLLATSLLLSVGLKAQGKQPTSEELRKMYEMTDRDYVCVTKGFNNDYDTTKFYLEYFKVKPWGKGASCFVYYVNPTWDEDHHFMICDCKPLDSALNVARKKWLKNHHQ